MLKTLRLNLILTLHVEACQDDQKKMTELDLVGSRISHITVNLTYRLDQLPPQNLSGN